MSPQDVRLHKKSPGTGAMLCFVGHALIANRSGLGGYFRLGPGRAACLLTVKRRRQPRSDDGNDTQYNQHERHQRYDDKNLRGVQRQTRESPHSEKCGDGGYGEEDEDQFDHDEFLAFADTKRS